MAFGSGMMERASELRDHTGRSAVDLRTREVGQLNPRNADGDELTEVAYRSLGGLGAIPMTQRPRAGVEGLACFTEPRRSYCAGRDGSGCSRAAVPRRRTALCAAEVGGRDGARVWVAALGGMGCGGSVGC